MTFNIDLGDRRMDGLDWLSGRGSTPFAYETFAMSVGCWGTAGLWWRQPFRQACSICVLGAPASFFSLDLVASRCQWWWQQRVIRVVFVDPCYVRLSSETHRESRRGESAALGQFRHFP